MTMFRKLIFFLLLFESVLRFSKIGYAISNSEEEKQTQKKTQTYNLYFIDKNRFVVKRDVESPYKSFLLYVEELHEPAIYYPIQYIFDVPLSYDERFISFKQEDVGNKSLKEFCREQKEIYEQKYKVQRCICCYCRQSPIFPLFSHMQYKKGNFCCNKKDQKKDTVLTLSCLDRSKTYYHAFYLYPSIQYFMLNVTLQQFDLTDEVFLKNDIKRHLQRSSYLLNPGSTEIDDEIFKVKIKFDVEKTFNDDESIEGNYLLLDSSKFKERIQYTQAFADNEILENAVILKSDEVDRKGIDCNKVVPYPILWKRVLRFCRYKRNNCFKKQLKHYVNLEKKKKCEKKISI